jgi:leucyl aminopeptidase
MAPTDEEAIQSAIEALFTGQATSIRAAATLYRVNRTTLSNRLNGMTTRTEARQTQLLLSTQQEQDLLKWILELEALGHPLSHGQIREMAGLFSSHSGGPTNCGKRWVQRFVQRHSIVHTKVGRAIDHLRVKAVTPDALKSWFELFERIKQQGNIEPENI